MVAKKALPSNARLTMGGDPEVFLLNETGHIAPIWKYDLGLISPYRKYNSAIVTRDGCAIELHPEPALCKDNYNHEVQGTLRNIQAFAAANRLTLSVVPKALALKTMLNVAPDDMSLSGCEPDYDGYTGTTKWPEPYTSGKRYAGGHMHLRVGTRLTPEEMEREEYVELYSEFAQLCDILIGIPLVAVLGKAHSSFEAERRRLYGQAGSFRVQPHGFEYRVPSSRILLSGVVHHAMYGMLRLAGRLFFKTSGSEGIMRTKRKEVKEWFMLPPNMAANIVNEHDHKAAQAVWLNELCPRLGFTIASRNPSHVLGGYSEIAYALSGIVAADQAGKPWITENWRENWNNQGPSEALYSNTKGLRTFAEKFNNIAEFVLPDRGW